MAGAMRALNGAALQTLTRSFQVLIATGLAGVLSYGVQALVARSLGPEEYGLAGTLLATYSFVALVLSPATVAITGLVASALGREDDRRVAGAIRLTVIAGGVVSAVVAVGLLLAWPFFASAWRIDSPAVWGLFAGLLACGLLVACTQSILRGLQSITFLSAVLVTDPLVRLVLLLVPGVLAAGTLAVVGVFGVAAAASLVVGVVGFAGWLRIRGVRPRRTDVVGISTGSVLLALTFWLAHHAPLALARATLSSVETGYFAVVVTLTMTLLILSEPISSVLFPMVTAAAQRGGETRPILLASAGLMLVAIGGAAVGLWLLSGPIISLAFGDEYAPAAPLLGSYAGSRALWVLVVFLASYALARGRLRTVGLAAAAAVLQVGLLFVWGQSTAGIAAAGWVGAGAGVALVAASSLLDESRARAWRTLAAIAATEPAATSQPR